MTYLDSSPVTAILLQEPGYEKIRKMLPVSEIFSSILMEAEVCSALHREDMSPSDFQEIKNAITWIHPDRPLSEEIAEVLGYGYLRGADLLHVATAIHILPRDGRTVFFSLDKNQRKIALACGFKILPKTL